jgi:hypothetical protein
MSKSLVIESGGDVYQSRQWPDVSIRVLHQPGASDLIHGVAKEHCPGLIIELGTGNGGITLALHEACPEADLWTFDVYTDPPGSEFIVKRQDQFTGGFAYKYPPEIAGKPTLRGYYAANVSFQALDADRADCEVLKRLLADKRRTLLYCDGGDVAKEVALWATYLSPGDLLGVHRWGLQFYETQERLRLRGWSRHRWGPFEEKGYMTRFWVKA